jgi:phosphoserine phosphatase
VNLLCFDCDSTLSAIEGIDELARLRGPETFAAVERMTREAMDGGVPLEEVFARRLALIRPTAAETARVAQLYIERVEPDAARVIAALKRDGWTPVVVSGGFRQAIEPLAAHLGIGRVEAVDIRFTAGGDYLDFDRASPTARARGKNTVIAALREELRPARTVMVGDGASDLETTPDVDLFVGFGRYAAREKIRAAAGAYITALADLPAVLGK